MQAVVARIESEVARNPTSDNLHALGLIRLFMRRMPEACRILERARATKAEPAIVNDLAAALLVSSLDTDDPALAAEALELLSGTPSTPATAFNLGIAFELIGLRERAQEAWLRFLQVDARSPWAAEARQRLAALDRESQQRPPPAAEAQEREVLEKLLSAWAEAELAGRHESATAGLSVAHALADRYRLDHGDPLLLRAVAAAMAAGGATLAPLARGHLAYAEARRAYRNGELSRCIESALTAAVELQTGGSPIRRAALLTAASCEFARNRLDRSAELAAEAAGASEVRGDGALLRGQVHWLRGLLAHARNQPDEALRQYERAVHCFETGHDPHRRTVVLSLIADLFNYLGRSDQAWGYAARALRFDPVDPGRRYDLKASLAMLAAQRRLPYVAVAAAEALQGDAAQAGLDRLVHARLLLGEAREELRDRAGATAAFDAALASAESLPDPSARRRAAAHVLVRLAKTIVDVDPRKAIELVERAAPADEGDLYLRLASVRAAALVREDQPLEAERILREAATRSAAEQGQLASQQARDALFAEREDLHDSLVRLLVSDGRPEAALDVVEALRAEPFIARGRARPGSAALAPLPGEDVTLYSFLSLAEELLVWRKDRGGVSCARTAISREELQALVERAIDELRHGEPGPVAARLGELLFGQLPPRAGEELVLAPDASLYPLPFAALPLALHRPPMLTSHAVTVVPALALAARAREREQSDPCALFLVGSPSGGDLFPSLSPLNQLDEEVRRSAASYACTQRATSAAAAAEALHDRFAVIHYAGHAVVGGTAGGFLLFADGGRVEPIAATELERWHVGGATVVLSSCSSAEGRVSPIVGRDGLTSALLLAGASSVIGSTWPVDDADGALFAQTLHRYLQRQSPSVALRAAQLELLGRGEAPAAWGAWRVTGAG